MRAIKMNMNVEDKSFFGVAAILGTITEFKNIMNASLISETFFQSLISASAIAFVSGFIGLFAKKGAEWLWNKIKC